MDNVYHEEKYIDGKGRFVTICLVLFFVLWVFSLYAMIHLSVTIFRRIKKRFTSYDFYKIRFLHNVKYSLIIYLILFIFSFSYCNRFFEELYIANGKVPYVNSGWFFPFDKDITNPDPYRYFLNFTFNDIITNISGDTDFLSYKIQEFFYQSPLVPYNIFKTFLAKIGVIPLYDKLPVYKQTVEYEEKIKSINKSKNVTNPKLLKKLKTIKN